jgi:hypothetical protein
MKYNHNLHLYVQGFCNYFLNFFAQDIPVRCTYSKATDGTFRFRKWRIENRRSQIFVEILFHG